MRSSSLGYKWYEEKQEFQLALLEYLLMLVVATEMRRKASIGTYMCCRSLPTRVFAIRGRLQSLQARR